MDRRIIVQAALLILAVVSVAVGDRGSLAAYVSGILIVYAMSGYRRR
jgi:hypothetical protein